MKRLMVMDSTGDSRIEFDDTEATAPAREEARALFERLTEKGARAFRTTENPGPIKTFDEVQGDVLLVPRIVGG